MSVDGPSKSAHYGANLGTGSMADSFSQLAPVVLFSLVPGVQPEGARENGNTPSIKIRSWVIVRFLSTI